MQHKYEALLMTSLVIEKEGGDISILAPDWMVVTSGEMVLVACHDSQQYSQMEPIIFGISAYFSAKETMLTEHLLARLIRLQFHP